MQIYGVFAKTDELGTGTCAVLVNGKERTLCANIGASAKYPTQHLLDNIVSFPISNSHSALFTSRSNNLLVRFLYYFK